MVVYASGWAWLTSWYAFVTGGAPAEATAPVFAASAASFLAWNAVKVATAALPYTTLHRTIFLVEAEPQ